MGIELDASEVKTEKPEKSGELETWNEVADGAEPETAPEAAAPEPEPEPEPETEPESEPAPPTQQPEQPAAQLPKFLASAERARAKVRNLQVKEKNLLDQANEIRGKIDAAYTELGRLVAESPDLMAPAPTVKISPKNAGWAKAPISVLKLSSVIETALTKHNGFETVGDLAAYHENNGNLSGLERITEAREKRISEALMEFIASQK
ncbi:hypothetical protein LCGC14_0326230 [marine sediment metagenome]|uniref:Uncharacterized protein n=1 Tax=marine sediment metagenome TaxID=412755 RepID=A0A0F9U0L2_9ZZZZ